MKHLNIPVLILMLSVLTVLVGALYLIEAPLFVVYLMAAVGLGFIGTGIYRCITRK